TQVASIIAATQNNNKGIAGVAPNVRVVPVKVCTALNTCPGFYIWQGLEWLKLRGISVVNMSFGGADTASRSNSQAAMDYLDGYEHVILVASAGNDGQNGIAWPASYSRVIAVGGTDKNGLLSPQSNYGPGLGL